MLCVACSHQIQPVPTETKIVYVMPPESMFYTMQSPDSPDLKFGTCIDNLVPALRGEIKKGNESNQKIIKWIREHNNESTR